MKKSDVDLFEALRSQVQRNCDISDARFGTDYGMCTYLMKMREYFRWEHDLGFTEHLDNEEVGDWLSRREELWEGFAEADFSPVRINGRDFDPFDDVGINRTLHGSGLVYSGGIGHSGKPHFLLGELIEHEKRDGYSLMVSGREYARDLASPPAMMRGETIFIRCDSLRRLLWEKLENWRWHRPENAIGRAFACYDFDTDLETALDRMVANEMELLRLHEQGEFLAGERLGAGWNEMLQTLAGTPAELAARAVRDHLADSLVTLPGLLADAPGGATIHFYIGNLNAMRRQLFPRLLQAYENWRSSADSSPLLLAAERGRIHWYAVARAILSLYAQQGVSAAGPIYRLALESPL